MLESPSESLGGGVSAPLSSISADERTSEAGLDLEHEAMKISDILR